MDKMPTAANVPIFSQKKEVVLIVEPTLGGEVRAAEPDNQDEGRENAVPNVDLGDALDARAVHPGADDQEFGDDDARTARR